MAFVIRFIAVTCIILGVNSLNAQTTYAKLYTATGYDYGRDVIESFQDSGLVITGSSSSFITGTADALILKTDSLGNFEWSYAYGGSDSDWGNKIIQTQDTGYVIAGYTNSFGAGGFDFYVVKTDQYGQHMWDTTFGGADWDIAHSIIELPNKDLVIVGETQSFGNGNKDGYVVCIDSAGGFKWEKVYGGSEDDVIYDLTYDGDTVWMVGSTASHTPDQNSDAWILNFNTTILDTNYTDTIGGPGNDVFHAINYLSPRMYFAGAYESATSGRDGWVVIHDPNYNSEIANIVQNTYNGEEIYFDQALESSTYTNFQVGRTNSAGYALIDQQYDFLMNSYTYNGGYIGFRPTFGEEGIDEGYGVIVTYDKAQVFVGDYKKNSTGGNGLLILKLKGYGNDVQTTDVINMPITTSIESEKENLGFDFAVYPNPASDIIKIQSPKPIQEVLIYNINGAVVYQNNKTKNINIAHLSSGMYIVKVKVEDQWIHRKIIKQ